MTPEEIAAAEARWGRLRDAIVRAADHCMEINGRGSVEGVIVLPEAFARSSFKIESELRIALEVLDPRALAAARQLVELRERIEQQGVEKDLHAAACERWLQIETFDTPGGRTKWEYREDNDCTCGTSALLAQETP